MDLTLFEMEERHRELLSATNSTGGGTPSLNAYLTVVLFLLAVVCIQLVRYYAEPNFPWHSYPTIMLGYFASFGILLLVPIDIATCVIARRGTSLEMTENDTYDKNVLVNFYNTFFTMVLILGSVVLVFEEYYNSDGYFTVKGKIMSSFKRMSIEMAPALLVGVVILVILIVTHVVDGSADALKLTAVIVTNTAYETFLMFLLGYALIEYPRSLWNDSNIETLLLTTERKASSVFKVLGDAQLEISLCVSDALKTQKMLSAKSDDDLKSAMSIIISECPSEFRSDRMGKIACDKKGDVTIYSLASLRTRLNNLKSTYKMAQAKVDVTKIDAYNLQDMVTAKNTEKKVIHWTLLDKDSTEFEFKWLIIYKPILMKILSVLCFLLSVLSFLGVVCSMDGVSSEVSVYFLAVHSPTTSLGAIAIFILLTLGYATYITSWAVFQMKIAYCMELVPYRTTSLSLSFNVRVFLRLAAPLAFFYLGWISENGLKTGGFQRNNAPSNITLIHHNHTYIDFATNRTYYNLTSTYRDKDRSVFMPSSFSNFYQLQSVGIVNRTFGTIFPVLLFCVLFLFVINAFNRILILLKLQDYQFGAAIVTEDQLKEGRRQLERHKKATERTYRRKDLQSAISQVKQEEESFFKRMVKLFTFQRNGGDESRSSNLSATDIEKVVDSRPSVREPTMMYGKAELKKEGTLSTSYKTIFMIIRSPGYLHFYKEEKSAFESQRKVPDPSMSSDPQATIIDLRSVISINLPDKKSTDNLAVDINMGNERIRVKFADHNKAVEWKLALIDWKNFRNDYGTTYPFGMQYAQEKAKANEAAASKLKKETAAATSSIRNPLISSLSEDDDDPTFSYDNTTATSTTTTTTGIRNSVTTGAAGASKQTALIYDDDTEADSTSKPFMSNPVRANPSPPKGKFSASNIFSIRAFTSQVPVSNSNNSTSTTGATAKPAPGFSKTATYDDEDLKGSSSFAYDKDTDKPAYLEGWVEKKGGSKTAGWTKKYLRIDEKKGALCYFKGSSPSEAPSGVIDLKFAKEIGHYDKNGKPDYNRFNVELEDKVYKFQVKSDVEGRKWVDGLNEWKDYFLMNMMNV